MAAACALAITAAGTQAGSDVVELHVLATNQEGHSKSVPARDRLRVLVDGTPAAIEAVSRETPALSMVLLIDMSNSVRPYADGLPRALRSLLDGLQASDRVRVQSIWDRATAPGGLTSDRTDLRRQIEHAMDQPAARRAGPSPVWDAVADAVATLQHEPALRAVLAFTDGRATGNRLGLGDVADRAAGANVALYFVAPASEYYIRQGGGTAARVRPTVSIEQLSEFTGGSCLLSRPGGSRIGAAFQQVVSELHATRTVTFRSPVRDGRPHRVEVRSTTAGLTIRSRRAFIAPR